MGDVIDELITAKQADRLSDVYLKDLRGRLKRFRERFDGNIGLVTVSEVEAFLRDLKSEEKAANGKVMARAMSAKSRNNYRAGVGTLFYFAEARGYVVKGTVDIESIAVAREKGTDIEILRPEQMADSRSGGKKPDFIPFLAIGALRTVEGERHAHGSLSSTSVLMGRKLVEMCHMDSVSRLAASFRIRASNMRLPS